MYAAVPSAAPRPSVSCCRSREDSSPAVASSLTGAIFARPKSKTLTIPAFGDEDIRWLDVAVHDALFVRCFESLGDVYRDFEHAIDRKRAFLKQLFQRFAIQELHRDEGTATFFGDLVDGANVGMVQRGSCACFTPKALENRAIVGEAIRQELKRDEAPKKRVLCFVDHAHATAADLL